MKPIKLKYLKGDKVTAVAVPAGFVDDEFNAIVESVEGDCIKVKDLNGKVFKLTHDCVSPNWEA